MLQVPENTWDTIRRIVEAEGLELVHLDYSRKGRGFLLRIDIDREGGVTVEDCSLISNQVSTYLDVEDFVPGEYDLEVSSPGLDRKFYSSNDYQKFLGRKVRVKTGAAVHGLHVIVGTLQSFDGDRIVVFDPTIKGGREYPIELKDVKETRLEVEI